MKKYLLLSGLFYFAFTWCSFGQRLDHVQGEILVQLGHESSAESALSELESTFSSPFNYRKLSSPFNLWLLSFDFNLIAENELLARLKQTPIVLNAQFNHFIERRSTTPNDPLFEQQWSWLNEGQNGGTPDSDIDADLAWDLTTGGTTLDGHEIVVCVIEGANRNHPDLQGNLWVNTAEIPDDGIDNDGNGYIDDYEGWNVNAQSDFIASDLHGTAVSGVIGARGDNEMFLTGVNWKVKIMHVDFSNPVESNVVEAYTYPLLMRKKFNETNGTEGALVVATNASWGINEANPEDFPIWCAIYDTLGQVGILNCVASSNENVNVDEVGDMPGNCSSEFLVCVTATDSKDERNFSGYGPENVDVAAPGESITLLNMNGGPIIDSGTSYASPVVSGLIALLYSAPCSSFGKRAIADPIMMARMIRESIFNGVDLRPDLSGELKTGGRVNAFNSIELLMSNCTRCEKPFGLDVYDLTDSQAQITWTSTDSSLSTNLRWREIGAPAWMEADNVMAPYSLEDLDACLHYEFQLEDICTDTSSGFTPIYSFETDGCCRAPLTATISAITNNEAYLNWAPVLAAITYTLTFSDSNQTISFEGLSNPFLELTGLQPCTDYEFTIEVDCGNGQTDLSPTFSFTTTGCGSCLDENYCTSESENAEDEWIANVSLAAINNTSVSNEGYADFTSISTDLTTWQSYGISVTPGFSDFEYNEWFTVWIDFNQDGNFDGPNEEVFNSNGTASSTVVGTILVPGDAQPGPTRMRVAMRFNTEPSPCDNLFNFGEVEDYCVNILEGAEPDCQPPFGLNVPIIGNTFADLSWNTASSANSYEIRIRPLALPVWTVVSTTANEVTAINLDFCSLHQFQVRSVCVEDKSLWSPSANFQTGCFVGTEEQKEPFHSIEVYPNPVQYELNVDFFTLESGMITFELYHSTGHLKAKHIRWFESGQRSFAWNLAAAPLNSGIYFLKLENDASVKVVKILVAR